MISKTEITAIRERLEALSEPALRDLAKKEGIEVPADVAKILLVDLLFEVLEDKLEERESQNNDSVRFLQLKYDLSYIEEIRENSGRDDFFPEHYNSTRIVLMQRDPFWAFVYWDIKGGTLRHIKKEHNADTIALRVLRVKKPEAGGAVPAVLDSFDIPIGVNDSSRYINIPEQDAFYCVSLILQGQTWEKTLITSNIVCVPAAVVADSFAANDIIVLSEVDKLDVARPGEQAVPSQQKTIPQRICSPETARFLEHGR
ncbi:MAG: DUF4912 domain-containing protein [Spirochaetales bacterium]|jgi:hypothetical protein|nr:DUF4912 domain-containing protein [Spirochaetales bacterium]